MSALDMVMQRQVPARSVAKAGEAATDADVSADTRKGAFSEALSQEKRNAIAERDKIASRDKKDAEAEGNEADDQIMQDAAQSDDILSLLAGLTSGAANSDADVEIGKAELAADPGKAKLSADPGDAGSAADPEETELTVPRQSAAAVAAQTAGSADDANVEAPDAANLARSGATSLRNGDDAQARADDVKAAAVEAKQTPGAATQPTAIPAGAAQAGESQAAAVRSSAATPAAVASAAAAGVTGKATQAPAADAGQDRQKDASSVREVVRALGLERGSDPAEPTGAESRSRGRNMGKQGDTADRQIEDRVGSKGAKVEVIESRRFMPAQIMSANTQLLTRSLAEAGSTALAAQSAAPAQPAAQTGASQPAQMLHTLKLQLNPVSLGAVTAVLKLTGEALSVEIKVETAEAYRQLKDDNQSILKALRGQGFAVEQITIQHVTGPDRSSSQTPQGFQASQQGAGSDDAQSSGKEGSRNNAGQQGSGAQGGQGHEQGSYAGSGTVRSDGVYL